MPPLIFCGCIFCLLAGAPTKNSAKQIFGATFLAAPPTALTTMNAFLECGEANRNDQCATEEEVLYPYRAYSGKLQALDPALQNEHCKQRAENVEASLELGCTEECCGE